VPNYLAIGFMSGGVLINALLHLWDADHRAFDVVVLLLIALAVLLKEGYWRFVDHRPAASNPETATGLGRIGKVRFLESPHSEDNYLLKEMGYRIGRKHSARLRTIARVLAFGLPLAATVLAVLVPGLGMPATVLAALGLAVGVLIERWLFFSEAKHTVQLYYGAPAV
jgi:DMSO reductase anchor subunit